MPELQTLIQAFGPSGAVLALGFWAIRTMLPWVKEYFTQQTQLLRDLVKVTGEIQREQTGHGAQLADIKEYVEGNAMDIARIYEATKISPQPSRARRRPITSQPH